ncbi:auxin-responsive protein SAUR36-like [Syzygium oleosum]|uniref:auxin-responsive protein SAUR36-like n=1 Tax=Syzygium oleosum TaxID=219896 RepID=UPI0024BA44BF|nr:auxin-responsive protein SAUR36-like [Syzygium oleosum]
MISPKKLLRMARKWQKLDATGRRRLSLPKTKGKFLATSSVADKGHFVVYTTDERRFMIPLPYLCSDVFQMLFEMSEEEFGLSSDGPIIMPCDAAVMEYIVSLVQQGVAKELEKALLNSILGRCS